MVREECPDCGEKNSIYKTASNKDKCALCGWSWEPEMGNLEDVPTRRADSECGDIITDHLGKGVSDAIVRRRLTTDGENCSVSPCGLKQLTEHIYMVACFHHID